MGSTQTHLTLEQRVAAGRAARAASPRSSHASWLPPAARPDPIIAIASYLGSSDAFASAVAEFAESYAHQNERDHGALVEAVKSGTYLANEG